MNQAKKEGWLSDPDAFQLMKLAVRDIGRSDEPMALADVYLDVVVDGLGTILRPTTAPLVPEINRAADRRRSQLAVDFLCQRLSHPELSPVLKGVDRATLHQVEHDGLFRVEFNYKSGNEGRNVDPAALEMKRLCDGVPSLRGVIIGETSSS